MINREHSDKNNLISRIDFTRLAKIHDQHCVSIYVPTHRAGEEVDKKQGQLLLKNRIKNLKNRLKDYNLNEQEIDNYLNPVETLLDDKHFWRNQSDCLVLFLNKQGLKYFTLPIHHDAFTYISDHFYLLPLIQMFNGDGKFYLLNLSLEDVKLYECTRHSIAEVFVENLLPEKLEEVVGFDYKEKSIQFRSGQGGKAEVTYHGQGAGKDDKNVEVEKFIRAVDSGLMDLIKDQKAPLVLASVDHYYPIYKNITAYAHLNDQHIGGNHEKTDPTILHEMAWPLVEDHFLHSKRKYINLTRDHSADDKTLLDINDIIPAAIDGRIEALFIQKSKDRYGIYDSVNRSLIIDENSNSNQTSLFNLAATHTWMQGGYVYISEKDEMPFKISNINALLRY